MAEETPLGKLPRDMLPSLSDTLIDFTHDADEDDPVTSQGFHDILERSHGLDTAYSRKQLTTSVQQKREEMAELDEQFQRKKDLSDRAKQMKAELQKARESMMTGQKILGRWNHMKKEEIVQAGLDTISQFVTCNAAFLPEILDMLKPPEAKLRLQIIETSNNVANVMGQLAKMQRRCDMYDQAWNNLEVEQQRNSYALVKELSSRLASAERRLDEKSQQFETQERVLQESIAKSQDLQQIIDSQRSTINDQMGIIHGQKQLIAHLPGLDQYKTMCRRLESLENEAPIASQSNETSRTCSLILANISTFGNESYTRDVDVGSLQRNWEIAVKWSQHNRTSLRCRKSVAKISGLVKPLIDCTDALTLARLLLVRAHTNPSYLSVALLEQLADALDGVEEAVATRVAGFVHAILQEKARDIQEAGSWSYSKTLLSIRCLSILASYVQGSETCAALTRIARSIRDKIPASLILLRVVLEHAITLLTGSSASLADTFACSNIARRIKTANHTLYPDGENLIVVDVDGNVGFVRPDQFHWHDEDYGSEMYMTFVAAPLLGTRRVKLPSLIEEMYIFDILHAAVSRAEPSGSSLEYQPDHVFVVE